MTENQNRLETETLRRASALTDLLDEKLPRGRLVLAIDGRCGSGKTTLAQALCRRYAAQTIHMDDFFLPAQLRTPQRYEQPGGTVHYERFMQEVAVHLHDDTPICYRRFDSFKMEYDGEVTVPPAELLIVEGSYCMRPELRIYYDIKVFLDISPDEQRRRILLRNGGEWGQQFFERWIPLEERYFKACAVRAACDLVLTMDAE